jgi:phosphodiesterase/alkaline phosphatase D-like protein
VEQVDSVHSNWAYASPHKDAPWLARPFPHELNRQRRSLRSLTFCHEHVSFIHGCSSGDPWSDSVMLWTRVTPKEGLAPAVYEVEYKVSEQADMSGKIIAKGKANTSAEVDYTVKVRSCYPPHQLCFVRCTLCNIIYALYATSH